MYSGVFINSCLLALGLALESFMVAAANGLSSVGARARRCLAYAAIFAIFHAVALVVGYIASRVAFVEMLKLDEYLSPIAVAVLLYIGVKMASESLLGSNEKEALSNKGVWDVFVQSGVASFDALAVGLTVPDYTALDIATCTAIISSVIFVFYTIGFALGAKLGSKFAGAAGIIGGLVFIGLAAEIAFGGYI